LAVKLAEAASGGWVLPFHNKRSGCGWRKGSRVRREARYTLGGLSLDPPGRIALTAAPDAQFLHGFTADSTPRHLAVRDDRRKGTWDDLDVYGAFSTEDLLFDDGFESGDTGAWSSSRR